MSYFRALLVMAIGAIAASLASCSHAPSPAARLQNAWALAQTGTMAAESINSQPLPLMAFTPPTHEAHTLVVYIEGDGLAWRTRHLVSDDPTPVNPVALKLAITDPRPNKAYLARPCQYLQPGGCEPGLWTEARFSDAVVQSTLSAIDILKAKFGAQRIELVGYSGGGAVAALVAARRDDVTRLVTVAGNLDHRHWTDRHRVTPLAQSLNPADAWPQLAGVPQAHLVGEKDRIIDASDLRAYADRFPGGQKPAIHVISGFDHRCCWEQHWADILTALDASSDTHSLLQDIGQTAAD